MPRWALRGGSATRASGIPQPEGRGGGGGGVGGGEPRLRRGMGQPPRAGAAVRREAVCSEEPDWSSEAESHAGESATDFVAEFCCQFTEEPRIQLPTLKSHTL